MRAQIGILILVSLPACMNASRLHGRVIDCQTQSPVDGADVQLTSPASGASWNAVQTAGDGSFAFDVPREAKDSALTLTAVKSGYRSSQKNYPSLPGAAQEVCVAPTLR